MMVELSSSGMLGKGLSLLTALGEHPEGVGPSELAREVGMPVSSTQRLLASMVPSGFVSFNAKQRRYSLGLRVFELSHKVSIARGLTEIARPVVRSVAEESGEPVFLTVLDGTEMLYVERAGGRHRLQISGVVGERGPLYCTASGKVLLAFLPNEECEAIISQLDMEYLARNTITDPEKLCLELQRTRERGYAVADEERDDGVRAVGAPVLNYEGWPVAAISLAAPISRLSWEKVEELVPVIRGAAREVGLQLPQGYVSVEGNGAGRSA